MTSRRAGSEFQTDLSVFDVGSEVDLDRLTDAQKAAYVAVRMNGVGVREHAKETGRSPGTVGNLLSRAEDRLGVRR